MSHHHGTRPASLSRSTGAAAAGGGGGGAASSRGGAGAAPHGGGRAPPGPPSTAPPAALDAHHLPQQLQQQLTLLPPPQLHGATLASASSHRHLTHQPAHTPAGGGARSAAPQLTSAQPQQPQLLRSPRSSGRPQRQAAARVRTYRGMDGLADISPTSSEWDVADASPDEGEDSMEEGSSGRVVGEDVAASLGLPRGPTYRPMRGPSGSGAGGAAAQRAPGARAGPGGGGGSLGRGRPAARGPAPRRAGGVGQPGTAAARRTAPSAAAPPGPSAAHRQSGSAWWQQGGGAAGAAGLQGGEREQWVELATCRGFEAAYLAAQQQRGPGREAPTLEFSKCRYAMRAALRALLGLEVRLRLHVCADTWAGPELPGASVACATAVAAPALRRRGCERAPSSAPAREGARGREVQQVMCAGRTLVGCWGDGGARGSARRR